MPTYKKSKELVSAYNDYKRDSIHGDGIMDDISNFGKKVIGGVKEGATKVGNYFSRVANMKKEIPPNVKKALDEIGDKSIISARIGRTPVQALVQGTLRTIANVPYDNLFHLFIELNIDGRKWVLEKIERITLVAEDRSEKLGAEFTHSFPVRFSKSEQKGGVEPSGSTMNELFVNTQQFMGKRFLPYQSNSNNCQVFIDSVLSANGLNTPALKEFVKQDTRSIFKNNPILRKFANTLTDIGGYMNALLQGGTLPLSKGASKESGAEALLRLLDPKRMKGMGNNGLTDTELEALCEHFKIKLNGIYTKDELPLSKVESKEVRNNGSAKGEVLPYGNYIINLNGQSHWCGMVISPNGNYWYDSYGFPAPENLEKLMGKYTWNDTQIQDIKSTACGYFVVAFLKFMEKPNKTMYEGFCNLFRDPKQNDKILFNLLI
jgi:hypothetical protein